MFARLFKRSAASNSRTATRRALTPVVEGLEGRTMMSASASGFVVTVNGDDNGVVRDDAIVLRRSSANLGNLEIVVNNQIQLTRSLSDISTLNVNGRAGDDTLTLDDSRGAFSLSVTNTLNFDGGTGTNTLVIKGGSADTVYYGVGTTAGSGAISIPLSYPSVQSISFANVAKVKEQTSAANFVYVGSSDANEAISLDNGEVSNDGLLRIKDSTPAKTFADVEFSNKTNLAIHSDYGTTFNPEAGQAYVSGDTDTVTLANTESALGLTAITVDTHQGADTVRIASSVVPITVDTGSGNDSIILGSATHHTVNGIGPRVTVRDTLDPFETLANPAVSTGRDTLTFDDSGDTAANSAEVSFSSVSGLGMVEGATYSGMDKVVMNLGSGNDVVRVRSSARGVAYTVNAGLGDDTLRLGSQGSATERGRGTVNKLGGVFTFNGSRGTDSLIVDDSGDTADNSGNLTASQITGLGMGAVTFSDVEFIKVMCGSGNDAFPELFFGSAGGVRILVDLGPGQL